MERGPKYEAYSELREAKLQRKYAREFEEDEGTRTKKSNPTKKTGQILDEFGLGMKGVLCSCLIDAGFLCGVAERELEANEHATLIMSEMTPPMKSFSKGNNGVLSNSRGSKSASAEEKKGGGNGRILMVRKSYANINELKSLSSYAASAISSEARGGRIDGYGGCTLWGCSFYSD